MKLRSTILLLALTSVNAQDIVPTLFNLFADFFVDTFNNFVATSLSGVDPFALDYSKAISLPDTSVPGCDVVTTTATFNIEELEGLSTALIENLEMTDFIFDLPEFDVGLDFEAKIEELNATFTGTITGDACGTATSQDFTGFACIGEGDFHFGFLAKSQIEAGFTLSDVDITSFSLTWAEMGVTISDLGDFNSIADALETQMTTAVTTAVNTLVNETVIENAIGNILPFSIP